MATLFERAKKAVNVFLNKDPTPYNYGASSSRRPDKRRLTGGNERSIVTTILNRMALDVAAVDILHVKTDSEGRFLESMDSGLNDCFNLEANVDQNAFQFKHDIVLSLFDEGHVAIVPTMYEGRNTSKPALADIVKMRVGKILEWYPKHVRVRLYNEDLGRQVDKILPKDHIAIIENPFYAVMNEYNSTLKRLARKLALLDYLDEQQGSGKLDLIIQLPYTVKGEIRKEQAAKRQKEIEMQLMGSTHGIAYIDSTEKVTQLNRPIDNQLLSQIEALIKMFYDQFGITNEILNGTANEATMLNYQHRMIEPVLTMITLEMKRKFLTRTARSQGQSIMFFSSPFELIPLNQIAELVDKLTRNEIMTSNEFRQILGFKPSKDPKADQLSNKNMKAEEQEQEQEQKQEPEENPVENDEPLETYEEDYDE